MEWLAQTFAYRLGGSFFGVVVDFLRCVLGRVGHGFLRFVSFGSVVGFGSLGFGLRLFGRFELRYALFKFFVTLLVYLVVLS